MQILRTVQNTNRRHHLEQTFVQTSNSCASYQQLGERITQRLKEIKKRRALIGKQRVVVPTNSAGKRTEVLLNPFFFNSLIPSALAVSLQTDISVDKYIYDNRRHKY